MVSEKYFSFPGCGRCLGAYSIHFDLPCYLNLGTLYCTIVYFAIARLPRGSWDVMLRKTSVLPFRDTFE